MGVTVELSFAWVRGDSGMPPPPQAPHPVRTTGGWLFAVCQKHMAKAFLHTAKSLPCVAHGTRQTCVGKEVLCCVPFIGHTANSLPSALGKEVFRKMILKIENKKNLIRGGPHRPATHRFHLIASCNIFRTPRSRQYSNSRLLLHV